MSIQSKRKIKIFQLNYTELASFIAASTFILIAYISIFKSF